jgi:hypothetical protein
MEKKIWIRDEHPRSFFRELRIQFLGLKILKFFDADSGADLDSGIVLSMDPGSGMEKIGSGMFIPDPQHCKNLLVKYLKGKWLLTFFTIFFLQMPWYDLQQFLNLYMAAPVYGTRTLRKERKLTCRIIRIDENKKIKKPHNTGISNTCTAACFRNRKRP